MPEFRLFSDEELAANTAELTGAFSAACAAGTPLEDAFRQAAEAIADLFLGRSDTLADQMQQKGPLVAASRQAGLAQLAETWGTALDAYYTVTVAAAELGALSSLRRDEAQSPADSVSAALALLHARACRTALEVHALLAAGFPGGAYARYRTMHELAVTTAVIAEHGRTPEHADLADRYLNHTHIEHYQQAEHYQRSSRQLGWQPFSEETMRGLKKERDRLTSRYGRGYREPYGWAAGLIKPLTFASLEAKADMDILRYLYITGSHLIHATAHGLRLTLQDATSAVAIAGPSDTGLAQPAQASLNALIDVTAGLVLHGGHPDDASILLNFAALHELRNRTWRLLDQAEDRKAGSPLHGETRRSPLAPDHGERPQVPRRPAPTVPTTSIPRSGVARTAAGRAWAHRRARDPPNCSRVARLLGAPGLGT